MVEERGERDEGAHYNFPEEGERKMHFLAEATHTGKKVSFQRLSGLSGWVLCMIHLFFPDFLKKKKKLNLS